MHYTAFIPPDFEIQPWSELGRQWPHPETYMNKLRLFQTKENDGDRRVLVTVHLINEGVPHA